MKARAGGLRMALAALGFVAISAAGQSYSIDWYKVAGGGGTSSNGQYVVSGTVGQPDAGVFMTNGPYSLTGGFWAITALQTSGAPWLTIRRGGVNSVIISWPSSAGGFVLQQSGGLAAASWGNFAGTTNDDGTNKSVTIQPPTGNEYFRLAR